jgi:D-3-phosphoglycerate dehydrogenase
MYRILTLNNISAQGLARFPAGHYRVGTGVDQPDAVLVRSADMNAMAVPASVKAVGRAGAGTNNIPVAALSARGVPVFNAPGANANAVKELVLAGMLMAVRNLPEALGFLHEHRDSADLSALIEKEKKRFVGAELSGRTLGVVGLGAIGVKVANAARALGMRVLGLDPHMTVEGAWQLSAEVMKAGSLNELYAGSDFVSFHVPLVDATRHLFNAGSLQHVRNGVVLINFARAGIVDAGAVREGLADGRIARYVTDFPAPELAGQASVLALPHLGASTREAEENSAVMVVDQLRDYLENGNIANAVNFPSLRMAREGQARVCVANRNRPNMIGQLSHVLGEAGLNIAQMHNASRGDMAYTVIDVDAEVGEEVLASIAAIDGILAVRVV